MPVREDGRKRVVIEGMDPEIDAGRFPVKRVVGDRVRVEADVFADGHDHVAAWLLYRVVRREAKASGGADWQRVRMKPLGNDRWQGEFAVTEVGTYAYTVAGVIDHFDTWRSDLKKRIAAGQEIAVDLKGGAMLVEQAAARARAANDVQRLRAWAKELGSGGDEAAGVAQDDELAALMDRLPDEARMSRYERELKVTVDRKRAEFSSWYEMFPRSTALEPGRHGTFQDVEARLEYVAALGFDVLYLPPVHPIGMSFRKGKNNTVVAEDGDVGSPWAIGAADGGHTGVHAELGTLEDFGRLRAKAEGLGLELAMDIAFQCAPDHPWVKEHESWFKHRADGTIQYAENPPKKYQDIYPLDFESEDWRGLWQGLKDVFVYWIAQGVKIFRVDNPHTKAFPFWEWCIGGLKAEYPDALFLSEAFTRPRVMQRLAKLGFTQSYTYFTWRNTKDELTEYVMELTQTGVREYLRPNFWPNTPDILPEQLQIGGLPSFKSRLVLAATLSSNFGVYGPAYEAAENQPLRKGSEEYLHSEKYQVRRWEWDGERPLSRLMQALNRARKDLPALQAMENLVFHDTDNPSLIAYSKKREEDEHPVLVVVNLDPVYTQSGWVHLDMEALGMADEESFEVLDLLADKGFLWQGGRNYVELAPELMPAHVFCVRKHVRTEKDFDYYL